MYNDLPINMRPMPLTGEVMERVPEEDITVLDAIQLEWSDLKRRAEVLVPVELEAYPFQF